MDIYKSKEIYTVEKGDYYITVEVLNRRLNIIRVEYMDEMERSYYTKLNYTKQIENNDNLLNDIEKFVSNRIDNIKNKMNKTIDKVNKIYGLGGSENE